jgi:hypothetical protein
MAHDLVGAPRVYPHQHYANLPLQTIGDVREVGAA